MKAFVESQYGYWPLIWMFHSRGLNNKINRIHERALRITYKDKSSTFQELSEKDNSVSIHHRNVQKLAVEIYKLLHGFSPRILNDIFVPISRAYNFRRNDTLQRRRVSSVRHGTESISFFDYRYGILYPAKLNCHNLYVFLKEKLKNGYLCNVRVGFVKCICNMQHLYSEHQKTHCTGMEAFL